MLCLNDFYRMEGEPQYIRPVFSEKYGFFNSKEKIKAIILNNIKNNVNSLFSAPEEFRRNDDFIRKAIIINNDLVFNLPVEYVHFAPESIKSDPTFAYDVGMRIWNKYQTSKTTEERMAKIDEQLEKFGFSDDVKKETAQNIKNTFDLPTYTNNFRSHQ